MAHLPLLVVLHPNPLHRPGRRPLVVTSCTWRTATQATSQRTDREYVQRFLETSEHLLPNLDALIVHRLHLRRHGCLLNTKRTPLKRELARHERSLCLNIAAQHLQEGQTAAAQLRRELVEVLVARPRAPQTQSLHVAHLLLVAAARRAAVHHARVRQSALQVADRHRCLAQCRLLPLAGNGGGFGVVALVQDQHAVERLLAAPVEELVEARGEDGATAARLAADQRAVRQEEHALGEALVSTGYRARQSERLGQYHVAVVGVAQIHHLRVSGGHKSHRNAPEADVSQVALAVVHQIRALADPHRLVTAPTRHSTTHPSLEPVLGDHARQLATLPHARSVAEQEAVAKARGTGELVALRGVDHRLQLERGEQPAVDQRAGQVEVVEDVGRDDGGEGAGREGRTRYSPRLDDGVGVNAPDVDLLRRVGVEDAGVVGLGEVHLADL